jgi:exodeoxyribonuclease V gamma subunit
MVPDVAVYAPHIQAVFGLVDRDDPHHIPFNVADQGQRQQDPLLGALEQLLHLPDARLGVSDVLDLLDVPALRQRFGMDEAQVGLLRQWLDAARIRWGLHAQHRVRLGWPEATEQNTWLFGLRRMMLGYAVGQGEAWQQIEPLPEVGGLHADLLGPAMRLLEALEAHWQALDRPAAPAEWVRRLRGLLQAFFAAPDGSAAGLTLLRAESALQDWLQSCDDARLHDALPLSVVREHWLDALEPPGLRQPFFAGGVTFASLMPMRAIPFRRVALLGMNDGDYPRTRAPMDFDLMAREHRAGDRSRREDDRYLFLEALLSAREHLHVSWVGRSIHDNEERPPSVLVAQLRDHIAAGWRLQPSPLPSPAAGRGSPSLLEALTTVHKLQPFHPAYFVQGASRHFSYANEWRATLAAPRKEEATEEELQPLVQQPALTLKLVTDFYRNPVRAFFQRRLDIRFEQDEDATQDHEPFSINGLENWQLQDELIRAQRAAVDDALAADPPEDPDLARHTALQARVERIARRGELPHRAFAAGAADKLGQPMAQLFWNYQEALARWPTPLPDAPLEHAAGSVQLQDWLTGLRTDGSTRCRLVLESSGVVTNKPRGWRYDKLLPHWAAHLAAHLDGEPLETWVISKAGTAKFRPLAAGDVIAIWQVVLQAYEQGMRRPLRFSVECACAWLKAMTPGKKQPTQQDGVDAVCRMHAVEAGHDPRKRDVYFRRAWPEFDAFWAGGEEFQRWAHGLMAPLRQHLGDAPREDAA